MLGAVIGDIVGSRFEWNNIKSKQFELLTEQCRFTDDSVMTFAVAQAVLDSGADADMLGRAAAERMQELGRRYPDAGYGGRFAKWLNMDLPEPYGSFGNGSAMRVSPCAYAAKSLHQARQLARVSAEVTHNHPEGVRGAEAVATAIFLARQGNSKEEIRTSIRKEYYPLDFSLDEIRDAYRFDVTCQGSVPQAIVAFLESESFEDTIRSAISIGGDSDTIAAIAGSIAQAYYGIPDELRTRICRQYLTRDLLDILDQFEKKYEI